MIGHIDLVIEINATEKKIGKLNYLIRYGNYGEQCIQVFRNQLDMNKQILEHLKALAKLYYDNLEEIYEEIRTE